MTPTEAAEAWSRADLVVLSDLKSPDVEAVYAGGQLVARDGADGEGARVASGVYFYRIEADGWTATRSMVVARYIHPSSFQM